ncbi:sensor domain-containing diguanylate cyclase [Salinicola aestuarinus]|uniref:sensor domain-containing diguanylate cyclase n=1 Tax=Salinicola aestuarinus TaxID=1949082 RepID=UPI000DA21ACC|nr:diguanylate cyclase [Salinicola aestuarinus]
MPVASRFALYMALVPLCLLAWPGSVPDQRWVLVPITGAVWLGMLAENYRWRRTSRWLLIPTGFAALALLSSYAVAESWLSTAAWQAVLDWLPGGGRLFDVRPPALSLGLLFGLSLNTLLLMRLGLGSPIMLLLIASSLATLSYQSLTPPPVHATALVGVPRLMLATFWLLWLHQLLAIWPVLFRYWRRILPPLCVGAVVMSVTLFGWQSQRLSDNDRLYQRIADDGSRLASMLAAETSSHLKATRRFASFWSMLGSVPSQADWERQARRYYDDFGYFHSIMFVDLEGVVLQVYPLRGNQALQGLDLYVAGATVPPVLDRPLVYGIEGLGGILTIRGGRGVVSFLPVRDVVDGTLLGAVGTMVSIDDLIHSLLSQTDSNDRAIVLNGENQLYFYDGPLSDLANWQYAQPVTLGADTLMLSVRPKRELLLELRERLPEITLIFGVLLAYLLYMVLYIYRRLKHQHRLANGANESLRDEMTTRERLQREIEWLATHDELTELPNRRQLIAWMDAEGDTSPLALLICDLDHFKHVNDHFGHLTGDRYLQTIAARCRIPVEAGGGLFARYGGEEFVACLPGFNRDRALEIAEAMRRAASTAGLVRPDGQPVTLSVGLAVRDGDRIGRDQLLQAADDALYRAKQQGRDRVEID